MRLPKIAVDRPVSVLMGVAIILVLGLVSLSRIPLDLMPNIEVPIVGIMTSYSNAGPHEVENLVSRPIEEALGGVNGVTGLTSTSRRGQSTVIAQFEWGTDMDFASLDVRERVDMVKDFLPDEADQPRIMRFDPTATPIIQLVIGGDRSPYELRNRAEDIKNQLERLDGVAAVDVSGGQERQIQVVLHPGLMQSAGVSIDGVNQALRGANLNLPAGSIVENNVEYVLRTTGEFTEIQQIRAVQVPGSGGSMVRLGDIAEIRDGFKEATQLSRYNGLPSVMLSVQKEAAANTVQVADRVLLVVEQITSQLQQEGLVLAIAADNAEYIRSSVRDVTTNAMIGGLLAMLMLFLFLRSFRTTLIIGIAIPISVVSTFVLLFFSNTSLNMVSLGGLALGVGMLVDNGIVVLENIYRRRELGETGKGAAETGAQEVGTAISASTLTTVSVFLPVVFVSGIAAEIFRDMALTVTFSLLASLIISLSVVPMLASRLLASDDAARAGRWGWLDFMESAVGALQVAYGRAIGRALRYRFLVVVAIVALLLVTVALIPGIGMEFMAAMDEGQINVNVSMPRGTPLSSTNQVVSQVEHYLSTLPEIAAVSASVGGGSAESGRLTARLVPFSQRERSTQDHIVMIRDYVSQIPSANITVRASGGFGGGAFGSPVQIELRGDDLDQLGRLAENLDPVITAIPGVQEVRNTLDDGQPEIQVQIDRDKAAAYGVTVGQVASALRTAVSGTTVTRYRTGGREIDVTVQLGEYWRRNPEDVENVPIATPRGFVPLKELVVLQQGSGPVSISRSERSRLVTVTAQLAGRSLNEVMAEVRREVDSFPLPPGVYITYGGENEQMTEAFGQLALAMLLGVLLVYMILASQFESLLQPLVIMFALPFSVIGVVAGLLVSGTTFSVISFVGVIMLAGIVVNNAIVLIDYINQLRRSGMERQAAVEEAGRVRLRPILMTTLTTVLAMIPLAIGVGEGSEMQRPIAVVVIGGLLTSTLLTLFVVPVFYVLFDSFGSWMVRVFSRVAPVAIEENTNLN